MEFRDLKKQYETLKSSIDASIQNVINNTAFISGPQVKELEDQLASYVGRKHCITCGNGTDALSMVLMAWDIKPGDAVFVPDFTFFATGEVVSFEGATPIFVDVKEDTFNMDPGKLEDAIQAVRTEGKLTPKLIIPVDLFGLPAEYQEILKIAEKYEMKILEDGAQGFGGMLGSKRACSFGDASITSFFPAKPLGCYGDGGAIFTDNDEMAAYLESIRVHGKGFQEYELENVNLAAGIYTEQLKEIVKTPIVPEGYLSSWAQYTIQLKDEKERNGLQEYLKSKGIPSMIYYPIPMHCQRAFDELKLYQECLVTEKLCKTVLALPMHPYLNSKEQGAVINEIQKFLKGV